jgi:hypothetical protein
MGVSRLLMTQSATRTILLHLWAFVAFEPLNWCCRCSKGAANLELIRHDTDIHAVIIVNQNVAHSPNLLCRKIRWLFFKGESEVLLSGS